MTKLSIRCLAGNYCRFFSTAPSTSSESWQLLQEKLKTFRPTAEQLRIIENERAFASAPEIVCHTNLFVNIQNEAAHASRRRHDILLEWLEDPKLNVGIEMISRSTYHVDVKALFYGLVWAHHQNKSAYILAYSTNDIVVNCATGIFNAKAEKEIFDKIKGRLNDDNSILRARVAYLPPRLAKEKDIEEPETRLEAFPMMTEGEFIRTVDSSIRCF